MTESAESKADSRVRVNPFDKFNGSVIPNWLMKRTEISLGAKICYGRLMQFAGKRGVCWPKQQTLATEIGVSLRSVADYIKELYDNNLITSEQLKNPGAPKKYYFLMHEWMEFKDGADVTYAESCIPTYAESCVGDGVAMQDSAHLIIKRINSKKEKKINTKKEKKQSELKLENEELFDNQFWPEYPRKINRKGAKESFFKAMGKTSIETIMAGLQQYKRELHIDRTEEKYIAHATTWLNGERWKDYQESTRPSPPGEDNPPLVKSEFDKKRDIARFFGLDDTEEWE